MEFLLPLPDRPGEGTGPIATFWNSLNTRLSTYGRSKSSEDLEKTSILSFLGGMHSVESFLNSGALHPDKKDKAWELLYRLSLECLPKFLLLYERHKLFTCNQKTDECVCHFLTHLRKQCQICCFEEKSQHYFKMRMVEGLVNPQLRHAFQSKDENNLLDIVSELLGVHLAKCDSYLSSIILLNNRKTESFSSQNAQEEKETTLSAPVESTISAQNLNSLETGEMRSGAEVRTDLRSISCNNQDVRKKTDALFFNDYKNISPETSKPVSENVDVSENLNTTLAPSRMQTRNASAKNKKKNFTQVNINQTEQGKEGKNGMSLRPSRRVQVSPETERKTKPVRTPKQTQWNSTAGQNIDEQVHSKNSMGIRTRRKRHAPVDTKRDTKGTKTLGALYEISSGEQESHGGGGQGNNGRSVKLSQGATKNLSDRNTNIYICIQTRQTKIKKDDPESKFLSVKGKPGPKPKPPPQEEGILPCDSCHKYFKRDWFLECHKILKHSSVDTVQCTLCKVGPFTSNAELLSHVRFQHRNGQLRYACPICEKSFRVRAQLREHHKAEHVGRVEFSCSTCPKKFKSAKVFQRHSVQCKINSEISYPCSVCEQSFSTKHKLERHERSSHTGEKPFACAECACRFAMKCDLTAHMKIHDHERSRRYQCHVCGKTFFERYYLSRHMLQHQGIKNFSCQHCGNLFTTNYGLRKHCWRKHGQPRPSLKKMPGTGERDKNKAILTSGKRTFPCASDNATNLNSSSVVPSHSIVPNPDRVTETVLPQQSHPLQTVYEACSGNTSDGKFQTYQGYQHVGQYWQRDNGPDASGNLVQESFDVRSNQGAHCVSSTTLSGQVPAAFLALSSQHSAPLVSIAAQQSLTSSAAQSGHVLLQQPIVVDCYQHPDPTEVETSLTPLLNHRIPDTYHTQVGFQLQPGLHSQHQDLGIHQAHNKRNISNQISNSHLSLNTNEIQMTFGEDMHTDSCNIQQANEGASCTTEHTITGITDITDKQTLQQLPQPHFH